MPGKVKVKIISGRNLPVMDRSSDTTDAYVEIKLGSTTFKTDVCRKSLHPQWNSDWYRFEVDDAELQDEPLQIRLMDHDTYSANDAIGKVYINLNPLLLPASSLLLKWNGEPTVSNDNNANSVMSGWVPVYDTMHGIRGEVNIVVKVELFSDFNKFRQSSCGVQFFCSPVVPHGFYSQVIHGFVEELVVNDDPEYQWIDKIRTPRASNEARQTLFFKLSGELQRRIGLKALDLGANAVIGYSQNFDLEGESGIVARGIGTAVTLVTLQDVPNPLPMNAEGEERAQNYLKFLSSNSGFRLHRRPRNLLTHSITCLTNPSGSLEYPVFPNEPIKRYLSQTIVRAPNQVIQEHLQHSSSLQTILKQEDMRRPTGSSFSQRLKNLKYSSKSAFSRTFSALRCKFSDSNLNDPEMYGTPLAVPPKIKKKNRKFLRTISDSSIMAEVLVRSTMQPHTSLDQIVEIQDSPPRSIDFVEANVESSLSLPSDFGEYCSSNASSTDSSSEEEVSENKESNVVLDTISEIVKDVEEKMHMQQMQNLETNNDDSNHHNVEFSVGDDSPTEIITSKRNPFNFGDFKKSNLFVLENNVKGSPVPPLIVTTDMSDQERRDSNPNAIHKLQMIANTALHNVLMENLRDKVHSHVNKSDTSLNKIADADLKEEKASSSASQTDLSQISVPESQMGERKRSYVDIMDLQTNPLQYNAVPRKIDFSVFNSTFLIPPKKEEPKKTPPPRVIPNNVSNQQKSNHQSSLVKLALGNVVKETAQDIMATAHVEEDIKAMKEVVEQKPQQTPPIKSNLSPTLLQLALGNVIKETAQDIMATARVEGSTCVLEDAEINLNKSEPVKSPKNTPPQTPTLLQMALGNVAKETAHGIMATAHVENASFVEGDTKESINATKEKEKINKHVAKSTPPQSPSLLQLALGNVIKETAQDVMATAHLESAPSSPDVVFSFKPKRFSKKSKTVKSTNEKPEQPSLFTMALGSVIRGTTQNIMATSQLDDKSKTENTHSISTKSDLPTFKIIERPKKVVKEVKTENIADQNVMIDKKDVDTDSIDCQDNMSLQTALNTVLMETVHDIMSEESPKDSSENHSPHLNPSMFANLNFRALRRSIDYGSMEGKVDSENINPEEYEEKEIAHSRVYHALVDKFKGILSNMHMHQSSAKKPLTCIKSHSLLQTALQNILTESVNDTLVISNKNNPDLNEANISPIIHKSSSLHELTNQDHDLNLLDVHGEKKPHHFLQNVMHNVLMEKVNVFTKQHFFKHEKHKDESVELPIEPVEIIKPSELHKSIEQIPSSVASTVPPSPSTSCSNNINLNVVTVPSTSLSVPLNTEIDRGNNRNTKHARLTHFHRHASSPRQDHIKVEYGHQRAESMGAKMSQSPAKVYTIPNIHRRSSDSDLSITPKGNSFTGSDRSGGCIGTHFMRNNILRSVAQENFSILEYPFLTMQKFPPGFVSFIGGSVSARSVKLLERISNPEQPESRDTWWSEIRMEIRSHARSLNCNAVLGYNESTSICEDVCVLSANGTAAIIGYRGENDNSGPLPFLSKAQPGKDTNEKSKNDTHAAGKGGSPDAEVFHSNAAPCTICHLPYNANSLPMRTNSSKCRSCRSARIPDVLIATIEIPEGSPVVGKGCFIQSYVCRPLRDSKGESNAKEISDGLPFLEYELHRLLVNKLKIRGMNAIFGLKLRISIGERTLIGTATGTAVFLSPLPPPALPKLVCDRDTDERKIAHLQKNLHDIVKKNIEIYQIKSEMDNHRTISDNEDSEDETVTELTFTNKDCCVLEIDDPEDREVLNLLMEPRPPDGFHVVNTEHVPGLDDLEIVKNLQMFTQIFRAKIQPPYNLDKHFHKLLETIYFKLRRMIPCALCDLQFRVETPESDEMQLCVVGMALGLGDPVRVSKQKRKLINSKKNEEDLIFKMEEDNIPENSVPTTTNFLHSQVSKYRPKSPQRGKTGKTGHVPHRERHGVDITPLSYVPGGKIEKYLGNLNFFFIRETTSIREEGGLSGFLHSFVNEVLAIVRAHVTALGGNAMVAYFMTECVLNHNLHKNQGQCLINVGGDVVFVTYYSEDL